MREAYKIFTVASGHVDEGAKIEKLLLKGAEIEIPALIVGEAGRGRSRGVLPVHLPTELYREWQKKGSVTIQAAEIGRTKAGKPKLFVQEETTTTEKIIGVFRTRIGFRGGNSHTGDRTGETEKDIWGRKQLIFHPFPGEILVLSHRRGELENYIGYKQNLELIKKWTGVELELNREKMYLEDGDGMLVMKLKYRVQDPTTKGKEVSEDDFEYFYVIYKELE